MDILNDQRFEDTRKIKIDPIVAPVPKKRTRKMSDAALNGLKKAREVRKEKLVATKPTRERKKKIKALTADIAMDVVEKEMAKVEQPREDGTKVVVDDLQLFIKNVFTREDTLVSQETPNTTEVIQDKVNVSAPAEQYVNNKVEIRSKDNLTKQDMDTLLLDIEGYNRGVLDYASRVYSNDGFIYI